MKFKAFTDSCSRHTDTRCQEIDVADVSRVIARVFDELLSLPPDDVASVISQGLALARKRQQK